MASEQTEPILRVLGARNDIIKGINRAPAERKQERELGSLVLHGREVDRIAVTIDGIDGQVHHVTLRDTATTEEARFGSIVMGSASASSRGGR